MNHAVSADGSCIYQLRIVLRDISPLIWLCWFSGNRNFAPSK
jgi:hypothetical protein